jgi:hypothetical protein
MAEPFLRFPDVQRVLVVALPTRVGAGHAGTETPDDLDLTIPFVRVTRVGGPSGPLNDSAVVDVDVFHTTYVAAELLAEQIRQYLCGPPPPAVALDRIACDLGPRELPWGDGPVRRWAATYNVISRRRWTT